MVLRGSTSTLVGKAHRHSLRFHKANQRSAILGNAARYGAIAGLGFAQAEPRPGHRRADPMGGSRSARYRDHGYLPQPSELTMPVLEPLFDVLRGFNHPLSG